MTKQSTFGKIFSGLYSLGAKMGLRSAKRADDDELTGEESTSVSFTVFVSDSE